MPYKKTVAPIHMGKGVYRVIRPRHMAPGKPRKTYWFSGESAKKEAEALCSEFMRNGDDLGRWWMRLDKASQALVKQSVDGIGFENLSDAARLWLDTKPQENATLRELAIRVCAAKEKAKKSEKHIREMRLVLQRFIKEREDAFAHKITTQHIEQWLDDNPEWSQWTRKNYLKYIRAMFSYGVKHGLVACNPAEKVEHFEILEGSPVIFTPEEAEAWMRAGERIDPRLVQFMAFCLFAGLRCAEDSEAWRVQPDDIREGVVRVQGKVTRAANRRLVTINETLRAWLDRYPGDFSPTNLRRRMDAVYEASQLTTWAQSITRHSYVSYSVAIYGVEKTAQEAGHTSSVLRRRYMELVTRAEAERFWKILPK